MGLKSGKFSILRYKVLGIAKNTKAAQLQETFAKYCAAKPKLSGNRPAIRFGWALRPQSTDFQLDREDLLDFAVGDGYLLQMQIEEIKIPQTLVSETLRDRITKKNSKRDKPMSRSERAELKAEIIDELQSMCLPTLRFIEVYWSLERQEVWLFSTSKKAQEIFETLFYKSFVEPLDARLFRISPPAMAVGKSAQKVERSWTAPGMKDLLESIIPLQPTEMPIRSKDLRRRS